MIINFYHTNDIHSNYNFLRKVHKYMIDNKTENDIYLDGGDYCDLMSIVVDSDKGESALDLLMQCKLDLMGIGNNEIDLEFDNLSKLVKKYPMICSNLTDANDKEIPGLKKSVILEKFGKKFLILSSAPYYDYKGEHGKYNKFFVLGNLKTHDSIKALKIELEKYEGQYDYIIYLSHSGHVIDEMILKQIPEINFIFGAHTHIIKSEGNYSMSGRGETLGKVSLDISGNEIKVIENKQIYLDEVNNLIFDEVLDKKIKLAEDLMSKELLINSELKFNAFEENQLINFICDALMKYKKADLAIMHNGIAENDLVRPVSKKSLLKTFPSKLNPTIFPVKGINIKEAVKQSFDKSFISQSGKGAGFRGSILGTLGFSKNVKIQKSPFNIFINDEMIDEDKYYKVVSDDYMQRGTWYKTIFASDDDAEFDKFFIRDLVRKYLTDEELFISSKIKRIY
ncbi:MULTISPECIES: 5'-nucleotidase C-terminal domain-containing protein [Helcococcus]|uniref:5'-nucleotidase C-terminal domain-containing protein n=1 Tax=Helcococcus bovis TaxID=3153252 RepID=A0ABW9F638_9FIRM